MNEKIKSPSGQGGAGSGPGPVGSGPQTATSGSNGGNSGGSGGDPNPGGNGNAPGGGPSAPAAGTPGGSGPPTPNNGSDTPAQMPPHPYGPPGGGDPVMSHYHMHQQPPHPQHMPPHQQLVGGPPPPPPSSQNPGEHPQKDVGAEYGQSPLGGPPPPMPGHHPMYGRFHHADPNMDPYRYGHTPMQQPPPGGKPQQSAPGGGPGIGSPNRPPPQRYIPGQAPQGPTPTLNSLLQSSHPQPPPQHRYTNSYDPQQPPQQPPPSQSQPPPQGGAGGGPPQPPGGVQGGPPPPQHGGPPPPTHQPHQSPYGGQQTGWAPPPRPYSPQLGPSQQYRTPPPTNTSRGQSPYPPSQGQNSGSYPSSPQQQQPQPGQQQQQQQQQQTQQQQQQQSSSGSGGGSGGGPPPPPQSSNQGTTPSQYSPYPQRYPTPPGPATGPNHRTAYTTHQYPEPNRPWPGGSSPAPSPGPGSHPLPPASPHHAQHGGPPPSSSPSHAPSPSPQPSQASPSPHQELIGQNSNDSSSGGGHSGLGSGPPGTPNPQQVMRPTPSPTGSSGSRSMSPAVAQNHPISRPSSNQSSSGPMQQPGGGPPPPPSQQSAQQQQQSQQGPGVPNSSSSASNSPQQGPPTSAASGSGGPPGGGQQPPPLSNQNSIGSQPPPQGPGGGAQGYPLPPHMHGSYKMGGQSPGPQGMHSGYPPPPPQQAQQYSQGSYPPRPQYPPGAYGSTPPPPSSQASSVNSMPPGGPQQYPGARPMPNHSGQYPPYQNWVPPSPQQGGPGPGGPGAPGAPNMGNHIQGKATPPPPQGSGSPRPLNYLKQHLQHKGGYPGGGPPGGPPQGYGNGPGMHPGIPMGPPHHMGPPHGPTTMGPPPTTPPQSIMAGGVSGGEGGGPPPPDHISQDNGLSSGSSGSASGPSQHPVTSVVTTGPDGTPMDDASQQSTISNASAASAEDPQCTTPKSRKNDPYGQSHLAPPSTSPGGVGAGAHPGHPGEDYEMNSPPNWARTPASPGFNSHVPQPETFRATPTAGPTTAPTSAKKSDSLCKLYEMDDNPERRVWLDKLRAFMDERRTPITTCPTISKQPLDLYRLYLYVKERGGFVEVCKVTKSKTWKDIAALLGIGASSSAAYTLRKHYTKNLLAYECHFDRGDIDPLPIIQQIEAGTKKKSAKAASVPSPGNKSGSSNSQDSFPAPVGAANTSMDGYPAYPGNYPGAGPQPDYGAAGQMPRPPSQSNAQSPHPGSPYPGQPGAYGQYGSGDQYNAAGPPGQFGQQQGQFPPQNRSMYPPYGPEGEAPPSGSNQYGPYGNRPYSQPPPGSSQTPSAPGAPSAAGGPPQSGPPAPGSSPYPPPGAPGQQDYYRPPDQGPQPRRHPDFVKDSQPYPGYNARPQLYGGWQGGSNQYRNQYPTSPSPQAWGAAPPRTQAPPGSQLGPPGQQQPPPGAATQWDQHRYPPQQQPPQPQQQQQQPPYQQSGQQQPPPPQWAQMGGAGTGTPGAPPSGTPGSPLRPPSAGQQRMPNSGPGNMSVPGGSGQMGGPQPGQGGVAPPNSSSASAGAAMPPNTSMGKQPPFSMPPPPQAGGANAAGTQGPGGMMPAVNQQKPPMGVVGPGGAPLLQPQSQQQQPPQMQQQVQSQPPQQQLPQQPPPQPQPQQQQQPFPPPVGPGPPLIKKEIVFPPDSVESTTPVLYRRKRLTKADICPVDPWRIFMAIRSGQLTECTWALDVLNVLLFDDSSVPYFGLVHLPGLLTLLLEHFQKNLAEMFSDEGDDNKSGSSSKGNRKSSYKRCISAHMTANRRRLCDTIKQEAVDRQEDDPQSRLHDNTSGNIGISNENYDIVDDASDEDEGIDLGQVKQPPNPEERVVLLANTPNYTMMSRKGLPVRLQPAENDIFITDGLKEWDSEFNGNYEETAPVGSNAWTYGFTDRDISKGIIDVFKSEFVDIPFARYIKGKSKDTKHKRNAAKTNMEDDDSSSTSPDDVLKPKLESNDSDKEMEDDEVEARLQQNTFNKKRRLFNNSAVGSAAPQLEPTEAKKSKLQNDEQQEQQHLRLEKSAFTMPEIKREEDSNEAATTAAAAATTNTDSDCREVDMELETITTKEPAVTKTFDPKSTVRDPALVLQRRRSSSSLEDECYTRDESSLYLVNESQDSLARRCICISNIFRNLSFVPGNESILAKSQRFLAVVGRLLLLNHEHLPRTPKNRNYDRGTEEDTDFSDSCSSLQGEREWWWDYLISIRENMLVIMANIAGHLDLSRYEELIARPLIDGLLHWAVCPSAHGQDPFPSCGPASSLSPQRLALEALCKLCVTDNNVDLVIATPPHSRLEKLCAVLTRHLCRNEDQVLREFSVNLLHYLAAADSAMARTVALQSPCISYLVAFIEQAEQTALGVANQHGINYLRENPDSMGTSLDMLRRAAGTLLHLAKHPDNRSLFMQQEQRLLGLVMSHILDQQVALIISRVLFQVSRGPGTAVNSLEYRMQQKQLQQKNGVQDRKQAVVERKPDEAALSSDKETPATTNASDSKTAATTEASGSAADQQIKIEASETAISGGSSNEVAPMSSNSNANDSSSSNSGGGGIAAAVSNNIENVAGKNPASSSSSTMIVSADSENSNSSSQITPTAAFNDVSNSSTNSNSCGTAASSLSQNSTNSSIGSCSNLSSSTTAPTMHHHAHHHHHLHTNNNNSSSSSVSGQGLTTSEQLKNNMLGTVAATNSSNSMNNMSSAAAATATATTNSVAAQQQQQITAPSPPATTAPPSQAPTANTSTTAAVA
ncbi:trithorax group protein osa isoform X5 [Musca domestica]|uniref:Trithorax group protein osa isoform X5 n=1 Tax=Musca domestica TaxID=7370 RepID=A0ABM3UYW2_MUSDO|nr:trithorax group protein osa isoform X5 [Musca domestica]